MKLVIAITGASGVQLNIANIGADKRNRRRNEKSYLMLNRIIYKKIKIFLIILVAVLLANQVFKSIFQLL